MISRTSFIRDDSNDLPNDPSNDLSKGLSKDLSNDLFENFSKLSKSIFAEQVNAIRLFK